MRLRLGRNLPVMSGTATPCERERGLDLDARGRAALIGILVVASLAVPGPARSEKTNEDRKEQCEKDYGGYVEEHNDGSFTCHTGRFEASIHCTSDGKCECAGKGCEKLGPDGGLGRTAQPPPGIVKPARVPPKKR